MVHCSIPPCRGNSPYCRLITEGLFPSPFTLICGEAGDYAYTTLTYTLWSLHAAIEDVLYLECLKYVHYSSSHLPIEDCKDADVIS